MSTDTRTAEDIATEMGNALLPRARRSASPLPTVFAPASLPAPADGETDCWSSAWAYAEQTGSRARYVEGIVLRVPGSPTFGLHAWVEEDTPFGTRIVETTPGYHAAVDYRGVTLDRSLPEVADWPAHDGTRYSAIQTFMAATGSSAEHALMILTVPVTVKEH